MVIYVNRTEVVFLAMKGRCTIITLYILVINLFYYVRTQNVFILFLSGVPAWRLMKVYSMTVGFSPVLYG